VADKIRVGIVGATVTPGGSGWGANAHVPALQALPGYELKAVCTAHEETARASAEKFGAELAFHDMNEMVAHPDIDLITVVVRVPLHKQLVMAAIEANKPVCCEWPLGADLADATLPESLRARGARVDAVAAYVCATRPLTNANLEALAAGVDAFTFASPSAIRGLLEGGSPDVTSALEQGVVATIGPVTSEAARVLGVRVDVEAVESTSRGLVEALCTYQGWALQSPSPTPP